MELALPAQLARHQPRLLLKLSRRALDWVVVVVVVAAVVAAVVVVVVVVAVVVVLNVLSLNSTLLRAGASSDRFASVLRPPSARFRSSSRTVEWHHRHHLNENQTQ